ARRRPRAVAPRRAPHPARRARGDRLGLALRGAHLPAVLARLPALLAPARALRRAPAALALRRDRGADRGDRAARGGVLPGLSPDLARSRLAAAVAPPRRDARPGLARLGGDLRRRPRAHHPPPRAARCLLPGAALRLATRAHGRGGRVDALPRPLQPL